MVNSKLNRHFHTHTKKLCQAPPEYPVAPPLCWRRAIPGDASARIVGRWGTLICQKTDTFVARFIHFTIGRCRYHVDKHPATYPKIVVDFFFHPTVPTVRMHFLLACSAYHNILKIRWDYPLKPEGGPHFYSLAASEWDPGDAALIVDQFSFYA